MHQWDREVGPAVRLAKFFEVMDTAYAVGTFCQGQSALARGIYRAAFPLVSGLMKREMGINAENAASGREITQRAFDFVVKGPGARGYLAGDHFTVADQPGAEWVRDIYRRHRRS